MTVSDYQDINQTLRRKSTMRPIVKVTYNTGDVITTEFNGTFEDAKEYFMHRPMNIGSVDDKIAQGYMMEYTAQDGIKHHYQDQGALMTSEHMKAVTPDYCLNLRKYMDLGIPLDGKDVTDIVDNLSSRCKARTKTLLAEGLSNLDKMESCGILSRVQYDPKRGWSYVPGQDDTAERKIVRDIILKAVK